MQLLLLLFIIPYLMGKQQWVPCSELNDDLHNPCRFKVQVDRALQLRIPMNCNRVVFNGDCSSVPYRAPIISSSQRYAGQQALLRVVQATCRPLTWHNDTCLLDNNRDRLFTCPPKHGDTQM